MLVDLRELRSRLEAGARIDTLRDRRQKRTVILGVAAAVVLLGAVVGIKLSSRVVSRPPLPNDTATAPAATAERVLSYSLMVQKTRNGRAYDQPFPSYGNESFENGWKFRLNFSSVQAGFVYLLNEGPSPNNSNGFTILYPDSSSQNSRAQIPGDKTIQTGWYVFDQNPGTEKMWRVWAAKPVSELEAARRSFNLKDKGFISDPAASRAVQEFLTTHSAAKPELEQDAVKKQTTAKVKGDLLLNLLELQHH